MKSTNLRWIELEQARGRGYLLACRRLIFRRLPCSFSEGLGRRLEGRLWLSRKGESVCLFNSRRRLKIKSFYRIVSFVNQLFPDAADNINFFDTQLCDFCHTGARQLPSIFSIFQLIIQPLLPSSRPSLTEGMEGSCFSEVRLFCLPHSCRM